MSPRLLLIGWDAADWKVIHPLVESGRMPNLHRLVKHGTRGQIATLHPPLSPMLWTSIATGKRPFKHGIHGFSEPTPDGLGVRPVTNLSRTAKAIWNLLNQNALRSIVIGWWPSHPAEPINGVMISDQYSRAHASLEQEWPLPTDAVYPAELAKALADLRIHPDQLTPSLVERFVPLAREIDQDKDKRLSGLLRTLAECMSVQSAAVWLLENQAWDFFAVYFDSIDHFSHGFMRYHPPRQSWICERDFELYHGVVSMAYQFHDEMLGALLDKAGPEMDIILLSDHGFHPDHLRPDSIPDIPAGPAIEHRDYGVLVMSGPEFKRNEMLHGASVLDITPTILALYGLAVAEDMDGKVLCQAFERTPEVALIPTWEELPGADARHPSHARLDLVVAHEALERMVALGYIKNPDEDRDLAVKKTMYELRYNLGEAYQDAGRHREAYDILKELSDAQPDEQRFAVRLFVSCQALGLRGEMWRIVEYEEGRRFQPAVLAYLRTQLSIAERRYLGALADLAPLVDAYPARPDLLLQMAELHIRLHRWDDAEQAYQKALALDEDNAAAHVGLSRIALRKRRFRTALNSALDAVQRKYNDPVAHFLLGRALVQLKEYEPAAEAFRAAVALNPNFPQAHLRLAKLLEKHLGDPESASEHLRLARVMKSSGNMQSKIPPMPVTASPLSGSGRAPANTRPALDTPLVSKSLIVVTGLPRSGTSMLMQMLAAGGMAIVSDGSRVPDEDNPGGYFESEAVKNLLSDSTWLSDHRGKAIKIVLPLLCALPQALPCRVILCERDLDEVLSSQERMLERRGQPAIPDRRQALKTEYARALDNAKRTLTRRPHTDLLVIHYRDAICHPSSIADELNQFLGRRLNEAKMMSAIDPALYRNRAGF